jgi:hypothetical protein
VLRSLRNPEGGPAPHLRVVALLIAVAMMLLAAPVLVPVIRWLVP